MKRKIFWLSFPLLFLLLFLVGYSQQNKSFIHINKVSFQSSKLYTRIILESDAPLHISKAAYSPESFGTLIVQLGKVQMFPLPAVPAVDPPFLKDLRLRKEADDNLFLHVDLAEPVPFRIQNGSQRSVIELNGIQRGEGSYIINPEAQLELEKSVREEILLEKVDISEKSDAVRLTAQLGRKAVTNVFALENPLRLVVDIFDTVYSSPTLTYPVNKLGIGKVKIGQFQLSNPYS
ncbi:MAG: AMIN domain-containing protein, partial [Candidatus Aminicenantales bacterium]